MSFEPRECLRHILAEAEYRFAKVFASFGDQPYFPY